MTDISEFINKSKLKKGTLEKLANILESNDIDIEEIGRIDRINVTERSVSDEEGNQQTSNTVSISINPRWNAGPEWPVVQQAKPVVVKYPASRPLSKEDVSNSGWKKCVVLPDMQIGFYLDAENNLHATHDDRAIDVALQIVRYLKPDLVIFNGDNLDFPEMSKYRLSPAFVRTTQASIDRAGLLSAQIRAAVGPDCEIRWLEGNHEMRISNYIIDNAVAAFGLKKANAPKDWPVLSIPFLCRFDEYDIQYFPGYPANETWINDRIRVIHGTHVVSNGSTAHRYLSNDRVSTIYGHIHRREWAERTRAGHNGPQTIMAMSPGCLARVDGKVPSTKGGIDLNGVPIPVVEDWQQGLAVVTYKKGNGDFVVEQVPIWDGWTIYHGKSFSSIISENE